MIQTFKRYPTYKDSGVPWLGNVPEHWQVERLKSSVINVIEQVPDRRSTDLYVALEHVESWTGRLRDAGPDVSFDSQVKRFRAGDVLFGKLRPYLAKVTRPSSNGVCVGEFLVLRPRVSEGSAPYVEYLLRSKPIIDAVSTSTFGAKMPRTDWGFVGSMAITLPPLPEQTIIARYLNYMDRQIQRYIRAKQKLIKLLNEQKQAILHQAVTHGLNSNVRLKFSGVEWLGEVPEHWEVIPLSRVLSQRKEKNNPVKTTDILSLSLKAGVIPYAEKGPGGNKSKDDISAYMLAYPGDIVVNSMNVVVGSVGLSRYFGAVSPVYYMLYLRQTDDFIEYFDAIFQDPVFQRSLFGLGNGIMYIESKTSGKLNTIRLRIPMAKLKRVLVPHPGPNEQAAIIKFLADSSTSLAKTIEKAQREIDLLNEYRTRLFADVVTGKLDVREAAAQLPEEPEESEVILEEDDSINDEGEEFDDLEEVLEEVEV